MREKRISQRLNLSTIAAAHGFSDGFQVLLFPILPLIMKELGLSNLQTGAIVSAQGIAVFLMLMPFSMLSDYLGRRKSILAAGLSLSALSLFGIGAIGYSYFLILFMGFISGLGISTFHPTATALVAENFVHRPGFHMGIFSLGGSIGNALIPAIIGTVALSAGWRPGVMAVVLPAVAFAVLVYIYFPEPPKSRQSVKETFSGVWEKILHNAPVANLIIIYSLRGIGLTGILTFLPFLIAKSMGADAQTAGLLLSVHFLMGAAGKPVLGFLYDRFNVPELLCLLLFTGFCVTLVIIKITALPILFIMLGMLGIVTNISPIIMTAATSLVDDSVRTSTVGMIYTAYELRFISPLIGGWIADNYSVGASFLIFASVLFLGGIASIMLKRQKRDRF